MAREYPSSAEEAFLYAEGRCFPGFDPQRHIQTLAALGRTLDALELRSIPTHPVARAKVHGVTASPALQSGHKIIGSFASNSASVGSYASTPESASHDCDPHVTPHSGQR